MLSKDVRPQNPAQYLRGTSRRCPGAGQDGGVQAIIPRQETCRNAVCALEAYLAARPAAITRAMRCPVRVHVGSDCAEPPQACQVGRPATTVRPFVRCGSVASVSKVERKSPPQSSGRQWVASKNAPAVLRRRYADFCNKICQQQIFAVQVYGMWSPNVRFREPTLRTPKDCAPETLARPKRIRPQSGRTSIYRTDSYYPPGNLTTLISIDEK